MEFGTIDAADKKSVVISAQGMVMSNRMRSSSLEALMVPPWSPTISFAMASPSPAPPLCELLDVSRR